MKLIIVKYFFILNQLTWLIFFENKYDLKQWPIDLAFFQQQKLWHSDHNDIYQITMQSTWGGWCKNLQRSWHLQVSITLMLKPPGA